MTNDKGQIKMPKEWGLIGAGRAGSGLASALAKIGRGPKWVYDKDDAAARLLSSRIPGCEILQTASDARGAVIIAVPDREIGSAGKAISGSVMDGPVLHIAGSTGVSELRNVLGDEIPVGAFHPIYPFAGKDALPDLRGIAFGITGDEEAKRWMKEMAAGLSAKTIELREEDMPLYHAACALASNYAGVLVCVATDIFRQIGFDAETAGRALEPLAKAAVSSCCMYGTDGLTGPLVRKDSATIKRHLQLLTRTNKIAAKFYRDITRNSIAYLAEQPGDRDAVRQFESDFFWNDEKE